MPGKKAFGGTFAYESATPTVYTPIANITKFKPHDAKADVIDVSSHDSPVDANVNGWREKLNGMIDGGSAQLDLNYDDKAVTHAYLLSNIGKMQNWQASFYAASSPTKATFKGFVKAVGPEVPFDNKQTCSVQIEISGLIVIT